MAKRWARSPREANQMFLRAERGTCQKCAVEFHRLTKGVGSIPTHKPGTESVEWVDRKWDNGVVTYEMRRNGFITTGMCPGSRKQPVEKVPPPPPPPDPATTLVKSKLPSGTRDGRPRDSQRQKVYSAEWRVSWTERVPACLDQRSAQQLADRMYDWLIAEGYSVASPVIEMRRGSSAEAFSFGLIALGSSGGNTGWIVAHEMAHLVSFTRSAFPGREWDQDGRSHGWEWASVYLRLVRRFFGVANHDALRDAFKAGKVKFRPKRRMTEAQRAAAADRLAAYRAKSV
jgi:hypothetical protein